MRTRQIKVVVAILVVILIALVAVKIHRSESTSAASTTGNAGAILPTAADPTTSSTMADSTSTTSGPSTVEAQSYSVGDCVMWDQSIPNASPNVVPCKDTHIFEVDGQADMPLGKYPTAAQWTSNDDSGECYALAIVYLGGPTAPTGKYRAASLEPTASAWANGQNYAWCGVALGSGSGETFASSVGSAKDSSKGLA
jgi:hypothetical protein